MIWFYIYICIYIYIYSFLHVLLKKKGSFGRSGRLVLDPLNLWVGSVPGSV